MLVRTDTPVSTSDDDRVELRRVLADIWSRKGLILASTFGFAILFFLLVSQVTSRYTARATVMLDPRSVQVLSSEAVVSDLTLNKAVLETEAAVLRSNLLLEAVVRDLDPDVRELLDPRNTETSTLESVTAFVRRQLTALRTAIFGSSAMEPPAESEVDAEEQFVRRLSMALRRSITVWREGDSYLIYVSVETENPRLSATLANKVVETYINRQLEDRKSAVRGATEFLQARADELRSNVEQAENEVVDFRNTQLAESGQSQATLDQQLLELSTQLSVARADLAQSQARYMQIQSVIDQEGITAAADLLTSPFVVTLRQQLSELSRERAELATRYNLDHPERQRVEVQIDLLSDELRQEVNKIVATMRNDVEVARSRTASVQSSLSEIETRSAELSRAGIILRQLERQAESVRANYESLLNRLNETRSTEELQRPDARLVETAKVPGAPSAPRVTLMTVFGGAVGFSLGLLMAAILNLSGAGFKRAEQIEKTINLPVLTSLLKGPWNTSRGMLRHLKNSPYDAISERFRQLRTSVQMRLPAAKGGHCVLVTSAVAGESKTSTILGLAHLESLAKRSCIVLDLDLRRSHLAQDFGYAAPGSLADALTGRCDVGNAIHRVQDYGFDLLTNHSPMPELMDSITDDALRKLIEDLKSRYDLVLVDAAPVMLVSDTLRISRFADAILLLVKQNRTRRRAVTEAVRKLEEFSDATMVAAMTFTDHRTESDTYGAAKTYNSKYLIRGRQ
ncbi:GumC family protein [Alloyangia pacifica]|uniref:GumC family protein n=1 Tax=Alloyangia pacifica TaxID=311180 RepID=UPI001CD3AF3C|nr:polysaccharide biosynthesis tyrosine autokinase [Alloyangia pacifica]MCA0994800.1 polysaccharide biosynthesis tyrosine autokinase [Alloyangia pacifica]